MVPPSFTVHLKTYSLRQSENLRDLRTLTGANRLSLTLNSDSGQQLRGESVLGIKTVISADTPLSGHKRPHDLILFIANLFKILIILYSQI
ncbi:hypothetical protein [Paenibacillus lutimineralis]|uniref:Uncharacterized protein n=1 Tax=Paenibacillus lutimineralis TaxID=2707005 RepID=A0A3Q9IAY4_9BACL|nr:hypothetical protein [Paenibacillus lutimineralis]AZS15056.1 hypothetical protein EI981_11665 [Paenibacillus lutimineralis]